MSVDVSAVARVLGIGVSFLNLQPGGSSFLPQRIAVFAQGATATTYSTTKKQITSSAQAGAVYGFGSPIHLIARELFPDNGDGVGTIPVTVYPLADHASGAVSLGDITPSGNPAVASSYRVRIGGLLGDSFTVPAGNLATAANLHIALRALGKSFNSILNMPVTVTWTYGSVTASSITGTGNGTLTALSVTGAPVPGAWTLKVNTAVTNGGVWTLTDPDGNVITTTLTQTVGVGQATVFTAGGLQFTVTDGTTDFALNDQFTITVPATKVNGTSKWKGVSANKIVFEVIPSGDSLVTFTLTQPTGGLNNPSSAQQTAALNQIGNVWETMLLNAMEITDTTTLDGFSTFGEGRWGDLMHKPLVCFTGGTDAAVATATTVPSGRKTDRTNVQLVAPGSVNLPFVVAARQLARIAKVANNNPPTDYGAQSMANLIPGTDAQQWDYPTRDLAVKAGCSTTVVSDGVVFIGDVVTFYHPDGDPNPAYRYVVDIVKLQNVIYSTALRFATTEWAAAPLIPDGQATANPNARRPRDAKAAMASVIDGLGLSAIISDPKTAKKSIVAAIDGSNPKRLNLSATVQLSGNTNVKSVDVFFGFFFGQAIAA